jgi:uncharacterized protein (TIGR02145 family)
MIIRPLTIMAPRLTPPSDEVQIGNQIWKTTYLAIDDGQGEIDYNETTGLYYYTTASANRVASSIDGWHLPTKEELDTLRSNISSNAGIISVNDGGTNIYGLDLRLAGMKYGGYGYIGTYGFIMTTTYLWSFGLSSSQYYSSSVRQGNVRLIKDT